MTNRRYAAETTVSVDRSKNDIETLLERHGADSFMVLPDNSTVAQFLLPQIEQAYLVGDMPNMLPGR